MPTSRPCRPAWSPLNSKTLPNGLASAASAAVLGLAIQDVEKLSTIRGPTTQPVLFPGQTRAMTTQGRPATATTPGFTAPPYDPALVKRTFDSPPNQLVLASYPNGRPGALRPDQSRAARTGGRLRGRAHRGPTCAVGDAERGDEPAVAGARRLSTS